MYLDITEDELQLIYEEIMTIMGAFDGGGHGINVDLTKEEVLIMLRNSLLKFEKETAIWTLQNQFINVYGMPAGLVLTNQLATVNFNLVRQITDYFASMQRVGGKIPWHKDYITLEKGRQIYFLDKESSKPYAPGTRRIHRVMWYAKPEIFGAQLFNQTPYGDDVIYSNQWNFTNTGLYYGTNGLGYLGYTFDTILMMQSMETRNKVRFSEFFHNLSGDVLEITPMPGKGPDSVENGARVFYYYFDEAEIAAGTKLINEAIDGSATSSIQLIDNPYAEPGVSGVPPGQGPLIANPINMQIEVVPWSGLSAWAKAFVKDLTLAKCKYIQGAKWRVIQKTFATGEMEYEIQFDYGSLVSEASDEEARLIENLRADLQSLILVNLQNNQKDIVEAAVQINKRGGRKWMIG